MKHMYVQNFIAKILWLWTREATSVFQDADLNTYLEYSFWGIEKSGRHNTFNFPRNNKTPPAAPYKKTQNAKYSERHRLECSVPVAFRHAGTRMSLFLPNCWTYNSLL
jgi:hypothetical protein